mgnify:CR=1 FL=1
MLAGLRRTSRMDGGLNCSSAMGRSNRIWHPIGVRGPDSPFVPLARNLVTYFQTYFLLFLLFFLHVKSPKVAFLGLHLAPLITCLAGLNFKVAR